jgi:membrane protein
LPKGSGLEAELERQLMQAFANSAELMDTVLEIKDSTLQDTKGGYMAGIGVIILFWSVMQLLGHIESSFNSIWQVRQSRPFTRKMADYIAIMLVAPVFIITASSVTVFINTNLSASLENAPLLESMKWLIGTLVKFSPYLIMWFVLTFTYIVLPNIKVKFGSALIAGIVAGTLLQIVQWLYIDLQIGITRLSAIYGSFAAIPLFIIWIQTSWLIVLLGAEISFAHQNVMRYEFESDSHSISNYHKRILSLLIMNTIVKNFHEGKPPVGAEMIAADHRIPVRIASEIMYSLSEDGPGIAGYVRSG